MAALGETASQAVRQACRSSAGAFPESSHLEKVTLRPGLAHLCLQFRMMQELAGPGSYHPWS